MKSLNRRECCRCSSYAQIFQLVKILNVNTRALFSRSLAELKYMGMIKNSRKKADHLAKLSWKGL